MSCVSSDSIPACCTLTVVLLRIERSLLLKMRAWLADFSIVDAASCKDSVQ